MPRGQFDLVPLQVAKLGGPQAVPEGEQDHGRVAMTVAARLDGGGAQPLDLGHGQVLPNWGI